MAKKKANFYVVWEGVQPGIYTSWKDCEKQVVGQKGAKYKGFIDKTEAVTAFQEGPQAYIEYGKKKVDAIPDFAKMKNPPIEQSISVDGAANNSKGNCEYQGVVTATKTKIFHQGPFEGGTNNIVEFLAIVHALAYCKQHKIDWPIYSDSKTALAWVHRRKANTKVEATPKNVKLRELIVRAENWLNENIYTNQLLKWETEDWGENPADFGRK